jgi:2-keto-4-pentenoate hydratase/2-oxohepta-3-ene-1,7-dioic acid hydratase in catechol pathway
VQDVCAGDLLATGTPGGCALQSPGWIASTIAGLVSPKRRQELLRFAGQRGGRYLKPGDRVEASIRTEDGAIDLGTQRNLVVGAAV